METERDAPDNLADPAAYAAFVEAWRATRVARLRSPSSWLTFVDRVELDEGDTDLPIGRIILKEGVVRFVAGAGLTVTQAGAPVYDTILQTVDGQASEPLLHDRRSYELFRRGSSFAVRVKDPESPARKAFRGIDAFPPVAAWRVRAHFERFTPPRTTKHQYDNGDTWLRSVPGLAHFEIDGRAFTLEPVLEEDSGRLFFNFGDQTNRSQTYPGGRFLYADLPTTGDDLILDFNLAFNPPCAFSPFATCPAIPSQNRLSIPVPAGELRYHLENGRA